MTVEILEGQSARLYKLVAPLVMSRKVLHYNHDYPFWTSPDHIWFVAIDKKKVIGFFPVEVKLTKKTAKINNYYMAVKEDGLFPIIVHEIMKFCRRKYKLQSLALMQHKAMFEGLGFSAVKEWKLYVKMEYVGKKHKA